MKKLIDILPVDSVLQTEGNSDVTVSSLVFDSRKVEKNSAFFAMAGTQSDGHDFIDVAIEKGANAIVCETLPRKINQKISYFQVKNASIALGVAASEFFGKPSEKLTLVGVTGTNGKTTTATLLYRLVNSIGGKAGLISTVCNYIGDKKVSSTHTTPDAIQLNQLFAEMVDAGCTHCFMEVSSHAIVQHRTKGLVFKGAIFTNITHDHLDYHKTFDEYIKAKKLFFDELPASAFALTNIDDRNGRVMVQNTKAKVSSYSLKSMADYKCKIIEQQAIGMLLVIDNIEVWTKLIGEFNAYNLLSVYSTAQQLGFDKQEVLRILSEMSPVDGRFEHTQSPNGVVAIVDYAHTPDALENVIEAIKKIRTEGNKLITVVGAGGNRDKTKRPIMAQIAVHNSELVILTSDNPRFEEPEDIIADMKKGIDASMVGKVLNITDRREAIRTACLLASSGDIVLVAGKGHETYQEVKGVKHHFDDKEEIAEIFKTLMP